mmetsp:Transcript_10513/g.24926  ORF Transcript_10513/g.24926 Transcript_10513/m.24926 type:complete len:89 (+) Transcript_10513:1984-2250(+)
MSASEVLKFEQNYRRSEPQSTTAMLELYGMRSLKRPSCPTTIRIVAFFKPELTSKNCCIHSVRWHEGFAGSCKQDVPSSIQIFVIGWT